MTDSFIRPVIHIDEQGFPIFTQGIIVNGISMVL